LHNPYKPPVAEIDAGSAYNNSGGGDSIELPPGVKGWSWGAFMFNWLWAVFNRTWIGLLALIPYIGFVMSIYLGIKGRELAWRNKRWDSIDHFNRVQRIWSICALVILGIAVLGIVVAILLPAMQR
jgi:hypothetical protein